MGLLWPDVTYVDQDRMSGTYIQDHTSAAYTQQNAQMFF